MMATMDSPAESLSAAANVALVVIAVFTVLITVWIGAAQLRAQRPQIKLQVVYFAKAQAIVPDPQFGLTSFTAALTDVGTVYRRYRPDYFLTEFLKVIVTNRGGMSIAVQSIGFENVQEKGRYYKHPENPPLPFELDPHRQMEWKELYSELMQWAGERRRFRYVVNLSNGDAVHSRWIKIYPAPDVTETRAIKK